MLLNPPTAYNLINGKRHEGGTTSTKICNPAAFETVVGSVESATPAIVDTAVVAARHAFPDWSKRSIADRIASLREAAARVSQAIKDKDLAALLTREQGKILFESMIDVNSVDTAVEAAALIAEEALSDVVFTDRKGRHITMHTPVGVVAAVSPWNAPIILSIWKVIPALAAGNCVVLKPAPNTPLAITEIIAAIASALPPGVLNLVHGSGDVGHALVSHPQVGAVSFTGSVASGRKVLGAGIESLRPVSLELGGNDPAIVLDDADLNEQTIRSMAAMTYVITGQVCVAIKRIYVHDSLYDRFVSLFSDVVNEYVVGNGLSPDVTMGPLNNEMQLRKVQGYITSAEAAGARITTLGRRSKEVDWGGGYFMLPSIATGVPERCGLVQEEQFGPVVPIMRYSNLDDAIRQANSTEYGLCSSVWSSDFDRALGVARRIEAGMTWINHHGLGAMDLNFGANGIKASGHGITGGIEGIREHCHRRTITDRGVFAV